MMYYCIGKSRGVELIHTDEFKVRLYGGFIGFG